MVAGGRLGAGAGRGWRRWNRGEGVGVGKEAQRAGGIDRIGRRTHFEKHPRVGKVRPAQQAPRTARGCGEIGEGFEDKAHLLGIAARKAARAELAQQIDAAFFAIKIEHQGAQHNRMVRGESTCDRAAKRRHVANGGLLGERGVARFQMSGENRDDKFEQSQFFHQHERVRGLGLAERFVSLVDQTRDGGLGEVGAMALDGGAGGGLDFEAELGGEAHGAHHAHGILAHPHLGIADSANQPSLEIVDAAGKIDHVKSLRAIEKRVDGEVAAKRVFLRRAEGVVEANERVVSISDGLGQLAESCHLDILAAEENVNQAKAAANQARVAEQFADLLRMGRGGDVEVLGLAREHQVAHTAADEVRLEARTGEAIEDLEDVGVDVVARDGMLGAGQYAGFQLRFARSRPPNLARRRTAFIVPAGTFRDVRDTSLKHQRAYAGSMAKETHKMDKFVTDIKKLRDNARKNMEKGSVTEGYRADVKQVVKVLNDVLATELVCVLRYKRHYYMAQGISSDSVKAEFLQNATEEQQHADWVAERITQLGGDPDFSPNSLAGRSHSEYVEGTTLIDMIKEDLIAERIAIESYSEIIRWLGDSDPTTKILIEQINKVEEEHANEMLDLLTKMG